MTNKTYYQKDTFTLDAGKITTEKHPVYGDMTVFHDVVIASEIVQPYEDGLAWKPREELEAYAWTVDGRWVMLGAHPEDGIITERDQVSGRTVNPRYVKDLIDPKTKRPNRHGVRADVQLFNDKVSPKLLEDMKTGKKQDVSIGFFYTKDETKGVVTDGVCKGEDYDYAQRNLFHDHLAAGIDNGRCPMPFCGLGADALKENLAGDPFAGFENMNECVAKIMEENPDYTEEQAKATCGKLKSEHESDNGEDDALRKSLREIAQMLWDELEEIKGMKDAQKKTLNDWYHKIPWKDEPFKTMFDSLNDETRILLTEEGLCPHCGDEEEPNEGESECEEGYEKNEEGECVKKEEDAPPEPECEEGYEKNEKGECVKKEETPSEGTPPKKLDAVEVMRRFDDVFGRE